MIAEAATNKAFLAEEFVSDIELSDFDSESINNSNSDSDLNKAESNVSSKSSRDSI